MLEKALELLKIFESNGYEAYLVGGFVRDLILKRKSMDVDICTNATPKEIKEMFNEVKLPFEQYGSVTLKYKKVNFEITTYRMDLEYKNRRSPSKILYTNELIVDLKRRDFTVNTLCMNSDEKIIDLLNGKEDIKNGLLRVVGNANEKLKEDSLRILRAIRFSTELNFELDKDLIEAIKINSSGLEALSFYRKKQELNRIFSSQDALRGLKMIKDFKLERYLGIEILDVIKTSDPIGMWAQVNPSNKYQFTSNEKRYLNKITRLIKKGNIDDMDLYKEGNYVCYIAAQILGINEVNIYDRYDALPLKKQSDMKFNAKDIIELLELKDVSNLKHILGDLEENIINKKLKNEYDEIKRYVIDTYGFNVL